MKPYSILHVVGARPHMMKLAPVYRAFDECEDVGQVIVHTGQHYDHNMIGAFLKEFQLPLPDYDLGVGSSGHLAQIGSILIELAIVLKAEKPDIVFVYGDTNSTAAGAIAAAKSDIPLAHVEAGLREFDKSIPEEVNKLITDAVTDLFFCPTQTAIANLAQAGLIEGVHKVGDVVMDLLHAREYAKNGKEDNGSYYFFTCHRAVNTQSKVRMQAILHALEKLPYRVVFPMHPRTRNALAGMGLNKELSGSNIEVMEPLGFWDVQSLIRHSECVITDSGGIVREAYFHKTACVIVDDQIEWQEILDEGWAVLAGAVTESIADKILNFKVPDARGNALGNGTAAQQILEVTLNFLNNK